MKQAYKFSRFNFFIKGKEDRYILYNSSTGVMSTISTANYEKLKAFIQGKGDGLERQLLDNLIKARFILTGDIDELKEFKVAQAIRKFKTNELILNIIPTMDCNFRCVYCYQYSKNAEKMAQGIQDNIIRAVEKRGNILNKLSVMWYGGEPSLTIDIIEYLSKNFIRLAEKFNFEYDANISTNGFLLTKEAIRKLLAYHVREYQVSFDGPPEIHDRRRIHEDGIPTFDTIFDNLKRFQEFEDNFQVSLRIHFDSGNLDKIGKLLDIFGRQFASDKRFKVYFQGYHSLSAEVMKKCGIGRPPPGEVPNIMLTLYRQAAERGLSAAIPIRLQPRFFYCEAELNYFYLIDHDGDILACGHTLDKKSKIGEVTGSGDFKIFHEKRTPWLTKDPLEEEKCRRCNLLPLCSGGCAYHKVFNNSIKCTAVKSNFKKILSTLIR